MIKHTPGPWDAINIAGVWIVGRDDGHLLTKIPAGSIDAEANARLIAAAPELLLVCKDLVNVAGWLQSFYNDVMNTTPEYADLCSDWNAVTFLMGQAQNSVELAQATIAKAKGEQP